MMKSFLGTAALPLALALLPPSAQAQSTATVTVTFETPEPKGTVMAALFDSEAGYKGRLPVDAARVEVKGPTTVVTFKGLKPGRYAVQSFQDLDDDGALGRNPFGMPTEPYGFSNNAEPHMGPAEWAKAAFEAPAGGASQRIVLR